MKMTLEEMKNDANWPDFAAVPEEVLKYAEKNADSHNQFVSWYDILGEDVYERTYAFKRTKARGFELTEVERYGTPCEKGVCVQKNMWLAGMSGWQVEYTHLSKPKKFGGYYANYYSVDAFKESWFDIWSCETRAGLWRRLLNVQAIFKNEEFKYCGWSGKDGVIDYIRAWKEDPAVEYFGRLGLKYSKMIAKKVKKDKQFARFLRSNKDVGNYKPTTIIWAYNHHESLETAETCLMIRREAANELRELFRRDEIKPDLVRIWDYIHENDIGRYSYLDYWRACVELELDMKDTKNLYPKDFRRMHDLRMQEYEALKEKRKKDGKKGLSRRIKKQASKWQQYETQSELFCIVFAKSVKDMEKEGEMLHHCVGRMGYDLKMAEGRSLIAFLRKTEDVNEPYVTIEYSLKEKKIRQIYGDHDSKPAPEVIEFAESWAKRISKDLRRKA